MLADQAKRKSVDSAAAEQAQNIVKELATDMTDGKLRQIGQLVAFTVDELQQKNLDFIEHFADVKNIGYGDRAVFYMKTGGIKAYTQAKGATTARSQVASREVTVETKEISARPAINIVDLRAGRVDMGELIREANREMTNKKIAEVEKVLQDGVSVLASPFYASGTGVVKATIDTQLEYFRRLGPVALAGDHAAVSQLVGIAGMATDASGTLLVNHSDNMIDEANANGFLGRYNGATVDVLQNAYYDGTTTPVLATDWIYIIPTGFAAADRNLKVVNQGGVFALENQNIDDMVYEVRIDQWFGAKFVQNGLANIGAYKIN